MPDLAQAAIAANRFGFGARPGELQVISRDPRGWIKAQFAREAAPPAQIAALPPGEDDLLAFGRWIAQLRLNGPNGERFRARAQESGVTAEQLRQLSIEEQFVENFRARTQRAVGARLEAALTTDAPARERAVHFWSNHFTVSAAKPAAVALPPSFEREAVRPHVAGAFKDMLRAATQHPGMLLYLDNWLSIGPNSIAARNPRRARRIPGGGRPTGINENLAREILELHTLGVNGGYTQTDVQALAAIITGWTYDRPRLMQFLNDRPGERTGPELFTFDADAHEPGPKTLLGQTYVESGVQEGVDALDALARHPATAIHVATKLARHYIADDPPPAAVARIAQTFARTDGDLRETLFAVIDSPEAWAEPFAKFKRPEEYAISTLRAANVRVLPTGAGLGAIAAMGQRVYAAPGPDGWADSADAWLSADLVWKRLAYAQAYAERIARADVDPLAIADATLGPALSAQTSLAVQRAESPAQGLAILFSAPEFQRR
ncbi:MAG: DUF1800 family protein [Alphaproteobacteria bacterium]|nr:DUF1800 family protein [Alphaproteobacteria bacterium]